MRLLSFSGLAALALISAGGAAAQSCDLAEGLTRLARAQTAVIDAGTAGALRPGGAEMAVLRHERAALARMDVPLMLAGTDLAGQQDLVREHLAGAAMLDRVVASGSVIAIRDHLERPATAARPADLARMMENFDCATGRLRGGLLMGGPLPLLPDGRRGAVWALGAALSVVSLLWAAHALRTRRESARRRFIVALDTRMETADGTPRAVRVTNLSRLGAQVSLPADGAPSAGAPVTLSLGETMRPARIAWRKSGSAGLVFDRRLPAADFASLTRRAPAQRPLRA